MNAPTPEQLEELRIKCAVAIGHRYVGSGNIELKKSKVIIDCPSYSRSYDAIMPEIKKLTAYERSKLVLHLFDIRGEVDTLSAEPWQLCEAFVRTKTEGESCTT